MHLTNFSDYALRVLIYLSLRNEKSSIAEVSKILNLSENHLMKVVHRLAKLGYIQSLRGKNGGIQMALAPRKINLGKIIVELEPNFNIAECFDEEKGLCILSPECRLKGYFNEAKKAFLKTLGKYSLADLTKNKSELLALMVPSEVKNRIHNVLKKE